MGTLPGQLIARRRRGKAEVEGLKPEEIERLIVELEEEMFAAAEELRFEYAAKLRDEIKELRRELQALLAEKAPTDRPRFTLKEAPRARQMLEARFGQGHRPNATIGRAVRLIMMNVMNTRPGLLDRATLGNPGKYSFCFAEHEADCVWEPFHVWRGYRREQSTVTLYANNSLYGIYNQLAAEPEPLLIELADAVCNLATPNVYGFNETLIVLAGEHTAVLRRSGLSRRQVQEFLMARARRTVADAVGRVQEPEAEVERRPRIGERQHETLQPTHRRKAGAA